MKWDEFMALWSANVGTRIPEESIYAWSDFVTNCKDNMALQRAIDTISDRYLAEKERNNTTPAPVLKQLKREYTAVLNATENGKTATGCEFCENSGHVMVIDNGDYQSADFPPDPAVTKGNVCAVPCPMCRGNEYGSRDLRKRVYRFCRPNSRINELRPGYSA